MRRRTFPFLNPQQEVETVEVKNIAGSTDQLPTWQKSTGKRAIVCSELACGVGNDLVGGVVTKCHGNVNGSVRIVPLCHKHHGLTGSECYYLKLGVEMVVG